MTKTDPTNIWSPGKQAVVTQTLQLLDNDRIGNGSSHLVAVQVLQSVLVLSSEGKLNESELRKAINKHDKKVPLSIESLAEAIFAVRSEAGSTRTPWQRWLVLFPIWISPPAGTHTVFFKFGKHRVFLRCAPSTGRWWKNSLDHARVAFKDLDPLFYYHVGGLGEWAKPTAILGVRVHAPTHRDALEIASPAIECFRGAIEFSASCFDWQWSSKPLPQRRFPVGTWAFSRDKQRELRPYIFNVTDPTEKPVASPFSPLHFSTLKDIQRQLISWSGKISDNSRTSLVIKSLQLYSSAMQESPSHSRFLSWWQLAECITLAVNYQGSTRVVRDRLAWMGQRSGIPTPILSIAIDGLSKIRNDFVHNNNSNEASQFKTNELKWVCDHAFLWLLVKTSGVEKVSQLEEIFGHANFNEQAVKFLEELYKSGYSKP